jgi:isochorismate hydrolase
MEVVMAGIPQLQSYDMPSLQALPTNTARWKINPRRAVLLVHDMQNYFVRLIPSPLRAALLENIASLKAYCVAHGIQVAYSAQPGAMSEAERGLLKEFWGAGMQGDAGDRAIVSELAPGERDWRVTKWRYSAFARSDLLPRMRECGRDQLIICGVYAHIGVLMTAVDSFSNDIETFLVADAVADFTPARHLMALEYAARCCAVVQPTREVVA